MTWDEINYGREYDLDVFNIVAVDDFNAGAMENKGLNIFNSKYILNDDDTSTDSDFALTEAIIAHEYFHNWTGNRVTCRDWFQLCLKEGLTVFREQEYMEDQLEKEISRINQTDFLIKNQFKEDAGPLSHAARPTKYLEINNFYTATVYEKSAEIIRMLKQIIGREKFLEGNWPHIFSKFSQLLVLVSHSQALCSPMQKNPMIITEIFQKSLNKKKAIRSHDKIIPINSK